MKTLKTLAILFMSVAFTGLFTGCSDDDDAPVVSYEWFEGKWNIVQQGVYYVDNSNEEHSDRYSWSITLNSDGTGYDGDFLKWSLKGSIFDFGCYEDGKWYDRYTGTFTKIDEEHFKVHYDYTEKDDFYGNGEWHNYHYVGDLMFTRVK